MTGQSDLGTTYHSGQRWLRVLPQWSSELSIAVTGNSRQALDHFSRNEDRGGIDRSREAAMGTSLQQREIMDPVDPFLLCEKEGFVANGGSETSCLVCAETLSGGRSHRLLFSVKFKVSTASKQLTLYFVFLGGQGRGMEPLHTAVVFWPFPDTISVFERQSSRHYLLNTVPIDKNIVSDNIRLQIQKEHDILHI
ncbi:hypothetical protein Cgig2_025314 [Carnegiea gigantea]|uniref:Uncharacterized protein n=1 Tax=Carnegiea gigantea TaxID=171969 RepID=A0A9Q1QA70_9CARY|nr:hypothetical protein Cgig2_025314 [Carnegiea gigantea]